MKIYLYILGHSNNPDEISTAVPYKVDDKEIFFGPCKISMREELRKLVQINKFDKDSYIVGMNGSYTDRAGNKIRKIVWAGKICRIMSFGEAYEELIGDQYKVMRRIKYSPLHVKPIFKKDNSSIIGYSRNSEFHADNDEWILDLIKDKTQINTISNSILLKKSSEYENVFSRDACILLENIFYAEGTGISIDKKIINILKKAQPEVKDIDQYYVFGKKKNGYGDGKRGRWLEINGSLGKELIDIIKSEKSKNFSEKDQKQKAKFSLKKKCDC